MILLVFDYLALSWAGMWLGLRARQHHRAVILALALVSLVPWLVLLLPWAGLGGYFAPGARAEFIVCAYAVCVLNDVVVTQWTWSDLRKNFRRLAAAPGAGAEPAGEFPETKLELTGL